MRMWTDGIVMWLRVLQVARLRAERKTFTPDPRFTHVVELVRSGYFGWEDYFGPIMDAITTGMTCLHLLGCCPVLHGFLCCCGNAGQPLLVRSFQAYAAHMRLGGGCARSVGV